MKPRVLIATVMLVAITWIAWRSQLWTVARPGDGPVALRVLEPALRSPADVDATLPAVPVGMERLASGHGVLLVHYWAPWEHASRSQAALLDSLRQMPDVQGLRVVMVCFDPFPSVARFVARQRLRLSVLIDGEGRLRTMLPCPSVPYTYVIDARGRIAVAQPGEVDWLSAATRAALAGLLAEPATPEPQGPRL